MRRSKPTVTFRLTIDEYEFMLVDSLSEYIGVLDQRDAKHRKKWEGAQDPKPNPYPRRIKVLNDLTSKLQGY